MCGIAASTQPSRSFLTIRTSFVDEITEVYGGNGSTRGHGDGRRERSNMENRRNGDETEAVRRAPRSGARGGNRRAPRNAAGWVATRGRPRFPPPPGAPLPAPPPQPPFPLLPPFSPFPWFNPFPPKN